MGIGDNLYVRNELRELQDENKELRGNLIRTEKTVADMQQNQIEMKGQLDDISKVLHNLNVSLYQGSPLERPNRSSEIQLYLEEEGVSNRAIDISFDEGGGIELPNRGSSGG